MKKYILFSILLAFSFILSAQKPELEFEEVFSDGKPFITILDIYQSPEGLIWFSSIDNELFYFDGYDTKQLINIPGDSTSFPQIGFSSIFFGKSGSLLMHDEEKIIDYSNFRLNKLSKHFSSIPDTLFFYKIIEDKKNNLWISAYNGLYFYNKKKDKLKSFSSHYNISNINSVLNNNLLIAKLTGTENHKDTSIRFSIKKDKDVAIISSGFSSENQMFDGISLLNGRDTIWQMTYGKTEYAGNSNYNRMSFIKMNLKKGDYLINYKWKSPYTYSNFFPSSVNFCGAKIYKYPESLNEASMSFMTEGIEDEIIDITISENGNVYLLTKAGIYIGNEQKGFVLNNIAFNEIKNTESKIINLYNLILDKTNTCWISSNIGLLSYNLKTNKLSQITKDRIYNIKFDKKNNFIWRDEGNWFYYDIFNKKIFHYDIRKEISKGINIHNRPLYQRDGIVDNTGNLFVSTTQGVFKSKTKKFNSYRVDMIRYRLYWRPIILKDSFLYHLDYEKGNTVLKTFNLRNNKNQKHFVTKNREVYSKLFYIDVFNKIWIASTNSVSLYNINKETIEKTIKLDANAGKIIYFYEDKFNQLWVFTEKMVYKKKKDDDAFDYIMEFNTDTIENKFIDYIIEIKDEFFIRTKTGIYSLNISNKNITQIVKFKENYYNNFWYHGNIIFDEKENNLWFSTETKLYSYSLQSKELHDYIFYKEKLREINMKSNASVLKDDNLIWITSSTGLYSFSIKEKTFNNYTMKDGLPSNQLIQIAKDLNDNIWFASTSAITKYDKKSNLFVSYYLGKDYNGISFIYNSCNKVYKSKNEIGFWGLEGLVTFNPNKINKTPPPVIITKFELFNKEFTLDSVVYVKKEINLTYNQNSIGFEFSALDYSDPIRNQYAYMLEGIDKNWIYTDYKERKAKYTNLSPGKYIFRVKASNSDGIWNEKGISLKIIITPPFWETWWFYTLEVLFALFLIYTFIKFRERKLRKDNIKLEQTVSERTIELEERNSEIETQKEEIQSIADNLIVSNQEVTKKKEEIEEIHKHISDSIQYASRIQQAVLPPKELINKYLPEHFILFKPRDVVSGDFYWLKQIGDYTIYAAADCTGHGVPGAFMSMLGISFLNEIVTKTRFDNPGDVLNRLRKKIKSSLRQTDKNSESKDGMDIALCVIDHESLILEYSGAYNPVYILREGELIEIKATRNPIGIYLNEKSFENHKFQLEKGDTIYTFSDGYVDQFGGEDNSKFKTKNFKKLLVEIYDKPMKEQEKILEAIIQKWQGETEQTDDIVVFGVRI